MWFVTTLEKLEEKNGWPDFGATRTPLFCAKKEDAIEALHTNRCDMWEFLYEYAIIEFIEPEYMYGGCDNYSKQFFKFDKEKEGYFEIDEPNFTKYTINIAIG